MKITKSDHTYVYFKCGTAPKNGVSVRLCYAGNHGWRLQTKNPATGAFDDMGASQRLARTLGETVVNPTEKITRYDRGEISSFRAPDGSRARFDCKRGTIEFLTPAGLVSSCVTAIETATDEAGVPHSIIKGKLKRGEAIYGSGERYDTTDQRGKKLMMFTYDRWDSAAACYMVIPLLSSSRGGGFFVNRYEYMEMDIGATDKNLLVTDVKGAPLDCYFFPTTDIADVLYGYSALSGFARKPAPWTYGMLVCRYSPDFRNKAGVMLMIRKMEQYNLPWSGIIMEGWGGVYNRSRWAEWKEISDYVHSLGKKVLAYMFVSGYNPADFDPSTEAYLLTRTNPDGTVTSKLPDVRAADLNPDYGANQRAHQYLDITNPAACEWFFGDVWETLSKEVGIDGAKIDFCELLPENYPLNFYDKEEPTAGAHHWFPTAFCAKYLQKISEKPDGGACFTRGGGIGSQRSPYMWAGDQTRKFERLGWQLTCLLNSGLSGVPFMSYDMSGYQYGRYARPLYDDDGKLYFQTQFSFPDGHTEEWPIFPIETEAHVFVRGTAFTAFTICMQTHGKVRRCYDFAEEGDPVTTDIYREYVNLHNEMTPYIDEYADIACKTGMPVVRHLILKYKKDERVRGISDEYLFGDAFLVAPELEGKNERDVYLPAGEWCDLNTGKEYSVGAEGLTLTQYPVAWAQLPVFYNKQTDSKTAAGVLGAIRTRFAKLNTLKYSTEA